MRIPKTCLYIHTLPVRISADTCTPERTYFFTMLIFIFQIHTFYEAVGYMISAQSVGVHVHAVNYSFLTTLQSLPLVHLYYKPCYTVTVHILQDSVVQERLIEKYMSLPNHVWDNIIKDATKVRRFLRFFGTKSPDPTTDLDQQLPLDPTTPLDPTHP